MGAWNYKELYERVWGYQPPSKPFELPQAAARQQYSTLGQPYYLSDVVGREHYLPVKINDILIPFATMSMSWKKSFVETSMPERGGTVKELISIDDYVFNIKGLFMSGDQTFPEQDIIDLHNLFLLNSSVTMRSVLSAIVLKGAFDEKVVIKGIQWPEMRGVKNARAFELSVESDMIFELTLK